MTTQWDPVLKLVSWLGVFLLDQYNNW